MTVREKTDHRDQAGTASAPPSPPWQGAEEHEALIAAAEEKLYTLLLALDIDAPLAQKTACSATEIIQHDFEEQQESSAGLQEKQPLPPYRRIEGLANQYAGIALRAQMQALDASPVSNLLSPQELSEVVLRSSTVIFDRIMALQ